MVQRYNLHQHIGALIIRLHAEIDNADCLGGGDGWPPVIWLRNTQGGVEAFLSRS